MMIVLRNPETGEMACVSKPEAWDGDTAALGYDGYELLEERDGLPPEHSSWVDGTGFVVDEELAAREIEKARLTALSRIEFMDEVEAKMSLQAQRHAVQIAALTDELAKRDVQIAELAQAASLDVTPLSDVIVTPTDPSTILEE